MSKLVIIDLATTEYSYLLKCISSDRNHSYNPFYKPICYIVFGV